MIVEGDDPLGRTAQVGDDEAHARMLFDTYHAAVKGLDPTDSFARHRDMIAHVQIADHPGRHEPGTGTIDFPAFFQHLYAAGYDGWVGLEYKPKAATTDGLGWLETSTGRTAVVL